MNYPNGSASAVYVLIDYILSLYHLQSSPVTIYFLITDYK